ncbi:MAG: energy-coupling factor transporter transmembrane protein EcfT [Clostridia bacterium]|nr:energy-coupling factor transporter transmembrane protein EcfT [Clostridia bacterium]
MLKDITIGQYFPTGSPVHSLDPRAKIIITIFYIVVVFLCKSFASLGLCCAVLLIFILISRVPVKMFLKSIKAILPIILFTAFLNIFYIGGGKVLFTWKFISVSEKGLYTAAFMTVRIILLIISGSALTYTTTPTMLTDGMERLLSPLKVFHVPVHTLAMMMTLALRFIPTLIDEIERITNAQKARGADLESGNFVQRAKALVPVLVPLFISAFRRAYELAFAMECRCYRGGEGRTRMKQMKLKMPDYLSFAVVVLFTAGVILLNNIYPVL